MHLTSINQIAKYCQTTSSKIEYYVKKQMITKPDKNGTQWEGVYNITDEWRDQVIEYNKLSKYELEKITNSERVRTGKYKRTIHRFNTKESSRYANEYIKMLENNQANTDKKYDDRYKTVERFSPEMMSKVRGK